MRLVETRRRDRVIDGEDVSLATLGHTRIRRVAFPGMRRCLRRRLVAAAVRLVGTLIRHGRMRLAARGANLRACGGVALDREEHGDEHGGHVTDHGCHCEPIRTRMLCLTSARPARTNGVSPPRPARGAPRSPALEAACD